MHPDHPRLLSDLVQAARAGSPGHDHAAYAGSEHRAYNVPIPALRRIAKLWLAEDKDRPASAILQMVDSLFASDSLDEKILAGIVLGCAPKARKAATPDDVARWLGELTGWAEVDTLCQNLFTAEDMQADWPAWRRLIEGLSRDGNINKRRASLVLLTGPVRYSDDTRFSDIAFAMIGRHQAARDILITKAVSWLLRSLTTRHANAVARYLEANAATLPKIAVRETRTKLETGTKSGRDNERGRSAT